MYKFDKFLQIVLIFSSSKRMHIYFNIYFSIKFENILYFTEVKLSQKCICESY